MLPKWVVTKNLFSTRLENERQERAKMLRALLKVEKAILGKVFLRGNPRLCRFEFKLQFAVRQRSAADIHAKARTQNIKKLNF